MVMNITESFSDWDSLPKDFSYLWAPFSNYMPSACCRLHTISSFIFITFKITVTREKKKKKIASTAYTANLNNSNLTYTAKEQPQQPQQQRQGQMATTKNLRFFLRFSKSQTFFFRTC